MPSLICGTKHIGVWSCPDLPRRGDVIDVRENCESRLYRVKHVQFTACVVPGELRDMTCSVIGVVRIRERTPAEDLDPIVWRNKHKLAINACVEDKGKRAGPQIPSEVFDAINKAHGWNPNGTEPTDAIRAAHSRVRDAVSTDHVIAVRKSGKVVLL